MPVGLGGGELLIILAILLLIFGASRVTELGKGLGQSIREFRKAQAGDDESPAAPAEPAAPPSTPSTETKV